MLDSNMLDQLNGYFAHLKGPIELVATLDDSSLATDISTLMGQIATLSPLVSVRTDGNNPRKPSFAIAKPGEAPRIHFAGVPMGHEFTSLVLALLHTSGHPAKIDADTLAHIQSIQTPLRFETYISLSCHNCPDVVQALNIMAANNPLIEHTMIDGGAFQQEAEAKNILAVPAVLLANEPFNNGRITLTEILNKVAPLTTPSTSAADPSNPFDVLVLGAGPAGVAAAIYAARKGIRTGIIAERMGGQVMDTVGIENLIGTKYTEGATLGRQLEEHAKQYPIEFIVGQKVQKLDKDGDGLSSITLANGSRMHSKSVIIATGARWRNMNVPGEDTYQNKGVAYCPHCDGPFFKGKRVAVIGGGNSGVEAAIDLAGIVSHVTLIEFDTKLRADEVLQKRLHSLTNVTVLTNTLSTQVEGNGSKVTALHFKDRSTEKLTRLELDGVFVQIGLLPNTDWLKGTLALNNRGEIITDTHGKTSLDGVYAAGDATDVPYKQIIISMGEGAKAALGAFDYLIRN